MILRAGPFVGHGFDGGGIPGWLIDMMGGLPPPENPRSTRPPSLHSPGLREANEVFLEHGQPLLPQTSGEVSDLQATSDGPLLLVQAEHAWACSNPLQAEKYLHEITRFIRESGINVPVINANDLWQDSPGHDRHVARPQRTPFSFTPNCGRCSPPRHGWSASFRRPGWGRGGGTGAASGKASRHEVAEDFSAQDNAGATGRGACGGRAGNRRAVSWRDELRLPRRPPRGSGQCPRARGNFALTSVGGALDSNGESGPPLGEAGQRGEKYNLIKRLVTFANSFLRRVHRTRPGVSANRARSARSLERTGVIVIVFSQPRRQRGQPARHAGTRDLHLQPSCIRQRAEHPLTLAPRQRPASADLPWRSICGMDGARCRPSRRGPAGLQQHRAVGGDRSFDHCLSTVPRSRRCICRSTARRWRRPSPRAARGRSAGD